MGQTSGGAAMLLSKAVRLRSVWTSLSVRGAKGELLDGFVNAWMTSWIPAMTRSVVDARGIVTLEGNQDRVLVIWLRQVSHIQTM
jgi:hypothetical protein